MSEEQHWPQDPVNQEYIKFPPVEPQRPGYFLQLLILFGLTIFGLLLGGIIAVIIFLAASGGSLKDMEQIMTNPAFANASKLIQVVSSIAMFFLPAFFFALIVYKKPIKYLHFNNHFSLKQAATVILIVFAGLFVTGLLGSLNEMIPISKKMQLKFKAMEDSYNDGIMAIAAMKNIWQYFVALLVIALTPAIVEETFFRGGVQQILTDWFKNPWIAIIVTSIFFSAIHGSYYGFLPRMGLGVVLGLLFFYSKNIWLNILAHFLNNAFAVTQLYLISKNGKLTKEAMSAMDDKFPIWLGLLGLVFLIALMTVFKKESDKVQASFIKTDADKLLS